MKVKEKIAIEASGIGAVAMSQRRKKLFLRLQVLGLNQEYQNEFSCESDGKYSYIYIHTACFIVPKANQKYQKTIAQQLSSNNQDR
jgi:hypothetical protein